MRHRWPHRGSSAHVCGVLLAGARAAVAGAGVAM